MLMNESEKAIMTMSEFLADAKTNESFQQASEEIAAAQEKASLLDPGYNRAEQWGVLANQVVGCESFPNSPRRS